MFTAKQMSDVADEAVKKILVSAEHEEKVTLTIDKLRVCILDAANLGKYEWCGGDSAMDEVEKDALIKLVENGFKIGWNAGQYIIIWRQ